MRWVRIFSRFTVRRLMVMVAVASVAFGAEGLRRRAQAFADRAAHYRSCRRSPGHLCGMAYALMDEESRRAYDEEISKRTAYFELMERKYFRAARHPWEVVEPDPPAPDPLTRSLGELTSADQW
jgi:hypothetical protein